MRKAQIDTAILTLTPKFKKGDHVIVDESGSPSEYEILSLSVGRISRGIKEASFYNAREVSSSKIRTLSEEEILRRATPVDSSANLFTENRK